MELKYRGLCEEEVQERIASGKTNKTSLRTTKSVKKIFADNILTLFNLINYFLFTLLFLTGNYKNTLFILIITSNIVIGIAQELKAKRTLDRMKVLIEATATVIRDGKKESIPVSELVIDDVFYLSSGKQITVDAIILESDDLEVDESLITGESEPLLKHSGDTILSGSYVVSGSAYAKATAVGAESYASKLVNEAKNYKSVDSEILRSFKKIIKFVTIFIFPVGIALFLSSVFRSGAGYEDSLVSTTAAIIGMIPEGLILLTSIAFAAGTIKLSSKNVVMQEAAGMEMIARIDTLCIDKTGTLTEGSLKVAKIESIDNKTDIEKLISEYCAAFSDKNFTMTALSESFIKKPEWNCTKKIQFSSDRKYSAASFSELGGKWIFMGAAEILLRDNASVLSVAKEYEKQGYRVLAFAESDDKELSSKKRTIALVMLLDIPRPSSALAIDYFKKQDVDIRVISGDSPETVANIAAQLGIEAADRYIDCSTLSDAELQAICPDIKVFGRVKPYQKKIIVKSLKASGKVVAMVGDGANDIPALRESDCSIAMASGTDAVKGVSHIVISDSDFSHVPYIVAEGRRVINNIERVASLFLIKTTFSILLSIFYIITGRNYPFMPLHMSLVSSSAVGMPSFFLALSPNNNIAQKGFFKRVLLSALPSGICITLCIVLLEALILAGIIPGKDLYICSLMITEGISLYTLFNAMLPLNAKKTALFAAMCALFAVAVLLFPNIFEIFWPSVPSIFFIILSISSSFVLIHFIKKHFGKALSEIVDKSVNSAE